MSFDDKYLNRYINSLLEMDIDDFTSSLPDSMQDGYIDLLNNIGVYIDGEISSAYELYNESSVKEKALLKPQIDDLIKRKNIINVLISSKILNDSELMPTGRKNVVFLETSMGKNCILQDSKSIADENMSSLITAIDILKKYEFDPRKHDQSKNRMLKGFKDVFEIKEGNIRLFYQFLGNDSVIALMTTEKKGMSPKAIYNSLDKRIKNNSSIINGYKEMIKDDDSKRQLIETSSLKYDEVMNALYEKARGIKRI